MGIGLSKPDAPSSEAGATAVAGAGAAAPAAAEIPFRRIMWGSVDTIVHHFGLDLANPVVLRTALLIGARKDPVIEWLQEGTTLVLVLKFGQARDDYRPVRCVVVVIDGPSVAQMVDAWETCRTTREMVCVSVEVLTRVHLCEHVKAVHGMTHVPLAERFQCDTPAKLLFTVVHDPAAVHADECKIVYALYSVERPLVAPVAGAPAQSLMCVPEFMWTLDNQDAEGVHAFMSMLVQAGFLVGTVPGAGAAAGSDSDSDSESESDTTDTSSPPGPGPGPRLGVLRPNLFGPGPGPGPGTGPGTGPGSGPGAGAPAGH
jgi:hypothetical protein